MFRTAVIACVVAVLSSWAVAASQRPSLPVVEVTKTPFCGCCSQWVKHMRAAGFTVRTTDVNNLTDVKATHGIPAELESCHTSVVAGYVIEGHVPASDVQRLLKERPEIAGIAVAGMPAGAPGMEIEGVKPQPFNVMTFDKQGQQVKTGLFARH